MVPRTVIPVFVQQKVKNATTVENPITLPMFVEENRKIATSLKSLKKRKAAHAKYYESIRPLTHSDSESENDEYLYPISSKQTARPHAKITVSGHPFDTGSSDG